MQTGTHSRASPGLPRHLPLAGAYSGYPCPLGRPSPIGGDIGAVRGPANLGNPGSSDRMPTAIGMAAAGHARELNEMVSPETLADSPFVVSTWWSIREQARRLFSRLEACFLAWPRSRSGRPIESTR